MNTNEKLRTTILAGFFCLSLSLQTAYGENAWRTDFDAACAQTNDAMALSMPELKKLIEQCDLLEKIIDSQDETIRKVFLKRLHMCRNLYLFVLEAKKQEQKTK